MHKASLRFCAVGRIHPSPLGKDFARWASCRPIFGRAGWTNCRKQTERQKKRLRGLFGSSRDPLGLRLEPRWCHCRLMQLLQHLWEGHVDGEGAVPTFGNVPLSLSSEEVAASSTSSASWQHPQVQNVEKTVEMPQIQVVKQTVAFSTKNRSFFFFKKKKPGGPRHTEIREFNPLAKMITYSILRFKTGNW